MKFIIGLLLTIPSSVIALSPHPSPEHIFSNPHDPQGSGGFRIPTSRESAVLGRRMLALTPLGDLATTFPVTSSSSSSSGQQQEEHVLGRRPAGLEGHPINLMDYIATCEENTANPTLLAIKIATTFRNAAAGSNVSLSIRWRPPYPPSKRISLTSWISQFFSGDTPDTVPYSAANLPRMSLQGYLEKIETDGEEIGKCFVDKHPDARYWLPGNRIHRSEWVRLVVREVYWIGGFGDRAYIGWIPVEEWEGVERVEWEGVRLPGEKEGWKEWAFGEL